MDVGELFFDVCSEFIDFLKTSCFVFLGHEIDLWQCLIGGIIIYLIFYTIFRVGD